MFSHGVSSEDLKVAVTPFLLRWGWTGSVDDFLQCWFDVEHHINQPLIDGIQRLRQKGYCCVIATNQEKYRLDYMRNQMDFDVLFDDVIGSVDVGAVKPEVTFYREATHRLRVEPEDVIFWDDCEQNVVGAKAFGWRAEHFTGLHRFVRSFRRLTGVRWHESEA